MRPVIAKRHIGSKNADISKILGQLWNKGLTEMEKDNFYLFAFQEKKKHTLENPCYKYKPVKKKPGINDVLEENDQTHTETEMCVTQPCDTVIKPSTTVAPYDVGISCDVIITCNTITKPPLVVRKRLSGKKKQGKKETTVQGKVSAEVMTDGINFMLPGCINSLLEDDRQLHNHTPLDFMSPLEDDIYLHMPLDLMEGDDSTFLSFCRTSAVGYNGMHIRGTSENTNDFLDNSVNFFNSTACYTPITCTNTCSSSSFSDRHCNTPDNNFFDFAFNSDTGLSKLTNTAPSFLSQPRSTSRGTFICKLCDSNESTIRCTCYPTNNGNVSNKNDIFQ